MDKKRAKLNVSTAIISKIIILILSIISKRFLIEYIGNAVNGLNTLFINITAFLSIVEAGMGTAITYCMYEPIANGNDEKVVGLYCLFKKAYTVIGIIVLILGIMMLPLLPYLSKGYVVDAEAYISYLLYLAGTVITYFYAAKLSLINAYKNNYISTIITSLGLVLQYVMQIIVLIITKSFIWFSASKVVAAVLQWVIFVSFGKYNNITKRKAKLDCVSLNEVKKNIKAMFLHKIGDVIFSTVDSLVISSFISIIILGYYSNYFTILVAMNEVLELFIIPLTSIIGHMNVESTIEEKRRYFNLFYALNFVLGIIFYLGFFAIGHEAVIICFGEGLEIKNELLALLSLTYFIQFMRQTTSVFKDSFGLFYKDRYVAIIAALLNICLSILLALWLDIYGVLLATIIVDILVYHVVEPLILFKYGFQQKPFKFYVKNYSIFLFFTLEIFVFSLIPVNLSNVFLRLLVKGSISIAVNIIPVLSVVFIDRNVRSLIKSKLKILKK